MNKQITHCSSYTSIPKHVTWLKNCIMILQKYSLIFVNCRKKQINIGTVEFITASSFKVEFTLHHFHESSYIDVSFCIIYNYYQYLPVSVFKRKRDADSTMNTALFSSTWKNTFIIGQYWWIIINLHNAMKIPKFKIVQWPTVGIIKHRNEIYTSNLHSII